MSAPQDIYEKQIYEKQITESTIDNRTMDNSTDESSNKIVHMFSFRGPDGCPLYEMIKSGKKTVEGRKNSPSYQKIKVGDVLLLSDRKKGVLECEVKYVKLYTDVKEYLAGESLQSAFGDPDKCRGIDSIQKGCDLYYEYVNENEILKLKEKYGHGFMGIGIRFVREYKRNFEDLENEWFDRIRDGSKIAEGRLNKSWVSTLQPFDMIEFMRKTPENENPPKIIPKIEVIVTNIKHYSSFKDLFDDVGLERVLPGKKTYDDGIKVYRKWYSEEKEKELGVVGIFFKLLKKI
jgi:ASC-1-like (ASCH) protein